MARPWRWRQAWSGLVPDFGQAWRRFPLAVFIALLFGGLHLAGMSELLGLEGDQSLRLSLALILAFLWTFACALAGEARGLAGPRALVPAIIGLIAIALVSLFQRPLEFQPFLALPALLIGVGLAPYLTGLWRAPNALFWRFNQQLWLGAGLALVSAVLFAGGLLIIAATLEALFDVAVPDWVYEKIWTLGLGVVAPINWLTLAPADFSEAAEEGHPEEFTARATATIVKYILAPLVLVYTAILYAYAVKIAADGVLPKGRVGPLVLGYGAVGTASVLLAYPIRAHGGPLVAVLWRFWSWLILVPTGLLALAVYQRVAQYGWTDERYLVALAGLWLLVMTLTQTLAGRARDLRLPPLTLAGLLLLASIGPWGALGVSVASQKDELSRLLAAEGRMAEGRLVAARAGEALRRAPAERVRSIVRYLARHERLETLAEWFEADRSPFAAGGPRRDQERRLLVALGVPEPVAPKLPVPAQGEGARQLAVRAPGVLALAGFERLAGPFAFAIGPGQGEQTFDLPADLNGLRLAVSPSQIAITFSGTPPAIFDVAEILQVAAPGELLPPLILRRKAGARSVGLLVEQLSEVAGGGGTASLRGKLWVFIGSEAPPGEP